MAFFIVMYHSFPVPETGFFDPANRKESNFRFLFTKIFLLLYVIDDLHE